MKREYRYRFGVPWALLCIAGFGSSGAFFTHLALVNDRGLVFSHLFELDAQQAKVFYVALAIASAGFMLAGLIGLLTPARTLAITTTGVEVPTGFLRRNVRYVDFARVQTIDEIDVSGTRILTLHLDDGKVALNNRLLKDKATYDEVVALVARGVRRAKKGA